MDVFHFAEFGKLKYVHHTIDTYSGFQWATALSSEKADSVIMHLLEVMAIMGIPAQIKTDNAPAYVSGVYVMEFAGATAHTAFMVKLTFCADNLVNHYMCDILPLRERSCTSTYVNELVVFIVVGIDIGGKHNLHWSIWMMSEDFSTAARLFS
ncbi:hypothetical protein STEG23_029011 [Scotinomys teguina]